MGREPDVIIPFRGTEIHVYYGEDEWACDIVVIRGVSFQFSNSDDRELFMNAIHRAAIIKEAEGGLS